MKAKSVTKFILCILLLGGCVDNTPPKKSTKVKHKETEKLWYDDEDFKKDTLYILWEKQKIYYKGMFADNEEYYYEDPFYSKDGKGIIFRFADNALIFEDGSISDELDIKNLTAYKIDTIGAIDILDEKWREKNELILKKDVASIIYYYFGDGNDRNRNSMYVTYIIKISDDKKKFTIYPVSWYYPLEYSAIE